MEKDIQREIGRYTEGFVDVQMISDTKAVVYIDDKDVPAAIGKGRQERVCHRKQNRYRDRHQAPL